MKKIYKSFLILIVIFNSCKTDNIEVKYYKNGQIKEKYFKKDSLLYEYYESGKIKLISGYFDSIYHGKVTHYYENGNVKDSGYFHKGEPIALAYFFNEEGKLTKTCDYIFVYEEGSTLNELVYYNNKGDTLLNKGHHFRIESKIDTIYLGKSFNFSIMISNSVFNDSIGIMIGNYDIDYLLLDTINLIEKYDTTKKNSFNIIGNKIGKNIIRGVILDYTHIGDTAIDYRKMYFTKDYYVNPQFD